MEEALEDISGGNKSPDWNPSSTGKNEMWKNWNKSN